MFATVPDPVTAGYVESLSRPGGNATGFASFEYSIGGKWLELLKEIAPSVTRVAVIRDSSTPAGVGQVSAIQTAAPSLRVELVPINFRSPTDLESAVAGFARPSSALLVGQGGALYPGRNFVTLGGLMSYGPDRVDQYRQAAGYVDRILKGEKPADLPVQTPKKYELVINLKTATALGLSVPPSLLARAQDVHFWHKAEITRALIPSKIHCKFARVVAGQPSQRTLGSNLSQLSRYHSNTARSHF